ncbi:MAG: hypothetical protein U1F60_03370 [Planctomycetota bacterium]
MKNPWYLVLGVLAMALILGLWWWQRGDAVAPPTSTPREAEPSTAEPSKPAAAATATPEPARSAAVEAAGNPTAAPAELHRFDILVVDAATQQPVADAEAYWSDADTYAKVQQLPKAEQLALQGDGEGAARRFGPRARSDGSGRLRVAMAGQGGWLYARAGDRYGSLVLSTLRPPPDGGYRLPLEREEVLSARVLDSAGASAEGVPVRLWASADANGVEARESVATRRSDAAGLVAFEHLQQQRRIEYGPHEGREALAFVVGVAIPGMAVESVVVDTKQPLPKEPIELRLPPTGALRVRFTFQGAPIPGTHSVRLHARSRNVDDANQNIDAPVDEDGWALFPRLPPGVPLFVDPSGFGMAFGDGHEIPPVAAGGLLQHQVELATVAVVLRGRVLGPDGQPLAKQSFSVAYGVDSGGGNEGVLTDERGVFLHFLRGPAKQPAVALTRYELRSFTRQELRLGLPPRELQLGVNELGDLRFGGEPLVCGGRFEGFTVSQWNYGVVASIERERIHRDSGTATWQRLEQPQVGVGRDGVFAAHGVVEPGRYRLRVAAREYLPVAPIEFRLGQGDLSVPLRRGLGLTVDCLLPEGAGAEHIHLDLVGGPAREPLLDDPSAYLPTDNRRGHCWSTKDSLAMFQWSAVEPGTYALQVSLPGLAAPVHTVADVVLPPPDGGEARLPTIDLRSVLRQVQLRLVDVAGQPFVPDGYAFLQPQANPMWLGTILDTSRASVLLPTSAQSVQVVGEGHRPCLVLVPADVMAFDVRVEPWARVELLLPSGSVIPEGCELLAYTLSEQARERVRFRAIQRGTSTGGELDEELQAPSASTALRAGGEPAELVVGDGPRRLGLVLRRGGEQRALRRFTPNEVVAGAPVTITLDAAELAAAAAALGVGAAK